MTGGGPAFDPNTQYLIFGTAPSTCQNPYAEGTCNGYRMWIGVSPALFKPGTIPLECGGVYPSFSGEGAEPTCGIAAAGFLQGTLEILDIDASRVVFRLTDIPMFVQEDVNATYSLPRCP